MEALSQLPLKSRFFTFVVLLCSISNGISQDQCTTLGEIYNILSKNQFKPNKAFRVKKYSGFDFVKFIPSGTKIGDDYFEIGYNQEDQIVSIEHFESSLRLTRFRLNVYNYAAFRVYTYQKIDADGSSMYSSGIFIFDKKLEKHFFLNTREQFGSNARGAMLFDEFPKFSFSQLSAIMMLRDDLYPQMLWRFDKGKAVLVSEFIYSDSITLKEEVTYIVGPESKFSLGEHLCLNNIEDWFDDCCYLPMTVQPRGNPKYRSVPFWIYGGTHPYR
ncbi:MAG: hypothetical protein DYG99_15175 [Bacteroidetes bacterium CHB5]|nr:hypothetical protein [Bacteroidetes bacterium CHB5]